MCIYSCLYMCVPEGGGGWSTGAKVAGGAVAVVGVGGLAVGGALLGTAIAEHGADASLPP